MPEGCATLSIPPMSDEPERIFSSARRTISWDRARLGDDTVETTQCIKHWKKNGHILKVVVAAEEPKSHGDIDLDVETESIGQ